MTNLSTQTGIDSRDALIFFPLSEGTQIAFYQETMRGCENEMTEKPSSHRSVCQNESRFGKIGISREGWTLEGVFFLG